MTNLINNAFAAAGSAGKQLKDSLKRNTYIAGR